MSGGGGPARVSGGAAPALVAGGSGSEHSASGAVWERGGLGLSEPSAGVAVPPTGDRAVVAELVGVRVEGRLVVPRLEVRQGERVLVTGHNGAGKSTLMQVLAGELVPSSGTVRLPEPARVGHLRQHEWLARPYETVLGAYAYGREGAAEEYVEELLSLGLFRPADLMVQVADLSYGQRRRVELARLVTAPVDLLLLDEPTNHFSPALVEQLEEALTVFQGALVVVTHDRRMRAGFAGTRLELSEGQVVRR
ncbi:ATP-binding cassette domain-containing protein [Nonomuraea sp. NPDC050556]|uniref:ATP-binding cassette domain-containing protein n=1 Tax=Nonomuraea sp. NPDC050556 TaxID=3364369 RepID=UPI00378EB990